MTAYLKIKGTQENTFNIGYAFKLDASAANYTWKIPSIQGPAGYLLSNDGNGNLYWTPNSAQASDSTVPYYIPPLTSYTVNTLKQALFTLPISIEGDLFVDGALVEV